MNDNFFSYDGPFFTVLNRISDMIILNVLWLVCCIPIVTIGASTTAMLYVTMKILRGEDAYIVRGFFKSFKENFIQSTGIWLIMLFVGALLVCDYLFLPQMKMNDMLYNVIFSAGCLSALIYAMLLVYLFPLQARLDNKVKDTFKNALLLSFRHLPSTILLVLMVFGTIFLIYNFYVQLFFVFILIAGSGIGMLCSLLYNRIFDIYIKPEVEEVENLTPEEESARVIQRIESMGQEEAEEREEK